MPRSSPKMNNICMRHRRASILFDWLYDCLRTKQDDVLEQRIHFDVNARIHYYITLKEKAGKTNY